MTLNKKVCLIVNPYAAQGRPLDILKKLEDTLKRFNIHFYTVIADDKTSATQQARKAASLDEYIFVVGGDGSLRIIAQAVKNTSAVIAFIPCGRGNDFARILQIPMDPIAACEALAQGIVRKIDVAIINQQQVYLSICSLGFDSIANEIANRNKFIHGSMIYVYAGLRALIGWKPTTFKLTIDGTRFEHVGYTVAVANSKCYGGGMLLAPNASITDGYLDVVLIGDISKFRMLVNFPRVFRGTHIHEPGIKIMRAQHVKIEADAKYTVFADGDPICQPPIEITIIPASLHVLTPRDAEQK